MHELMTEARSLLFALARWVVAAVLLGAIFLSVGVHMQTVRGVYVPIPTITTDSIAATFFSNAATALLPQGTRLLAANPADAFLIETKVALSLAAAIILPFFFVSAFRYLSPALTRRERRILMILTVPTLLLFFSGAYFAYRFVLPTVFAFLFMFVPAIGAEPLFSADSFFSSVLMLLFVAGILFELPVVMVALSALQLIAARFWRSHLRAAALTILILTAIITPDGSGVSMLILSAPLLALYMLGAGLSELYTPHRKNAAH